VRRRMGATDRALLWCIGGFPQNKTGAHRIRKELINSIASSSKFSTDARFALVVMHDGSIDCKTLKDGSPFLADTRCTSLPPLAPLLDDGPGSRAVCKVGPRQLMANILYLTQVAPDLLNLNKTVADFFSYRFRDKRTMASGNSSIAKRDDTITKSHGPMHAELLGLGAWYRYFVHLMLPYGLERILYVDADTCTMRSLGPILASNESAPLVVARREVAPVQERVMMRDFKGLNGAALKAAHDLFGFNMWQEPLSFNNGVMLFNLVPYCLHGIWEKMQLFTTRHAMRGTRMFHAMADIHGGGSALGDNDVVVVVARAVSHFVGAEWNCRQPVQFNTRKTREGVRCRIMHAHETNGDGSNMRWMPAGSKNFCGARLAASWTASRALATNTTKGKEPLHDTTSQ